VQHLGAVLTFLPDEMTMSNQYSINQIFPTTILYKDSDLVDQELVRISKNLINLHATKPFYSNCYSTVSTFSQVLEEPGFERLSKFLFDLVAVFLDVQKINGDNLRFLDSWLNLYEPGGYQDLHNHHDSMLSGVFWLQSSGEKDFIVQAPWHFHQPKIPKYTELNLSNSHNIEYNSIPGRGMIFMSHTLHRTLPTSVERMSLSFNIG
jgi:hypothetical protein